MAGEHLIFIDSYNDQISNEQTSAKGEVCSLLDTGTVSLRDTRRKNFKILEQRKERYIFLLTANCATMAVKEESEAVLCRRNV